MSSEERKKLLGQIILRIDDEHGHHIIRKNFHPLDKHEHYTIEGYSQHPENYLKPPEYFFPFLEGEVADEFKKQGNEWRVNQ